MDTLPIIAVLGTDVDIEVSVNVDTKAISIEPVVNSQTTDVYHRLCCAMRVFEQLATKHYRNPIIFFSGGMPPYLEDLYRKTLLDVLKDLSRLLFVEGYSLNVFLITESSAMKTFFSQMIGFDLGLYEELISRDSIGNAFFLRAYLTNNLKADEINTLSVVTSHYHIERVKIIFDHVMKTFMDICYYSVENPFGKAVDETGKIKKLKEDLLMSTKPGDMESILRYLAEFHPFYGAPYVKYSYDILKRKSFSEKEDYCKKKVLNRLSDLTRSVLKEQCGVLYDIRVTTHKKMIEISINPRKAYFLMS